MDVGREFAKSAPKPVHATDAVICYDPFHVVQLVTAALDKVCREVWKGLRRLPDRPATRRVQGCSWLGRRELPRKVDPRPEGH
jgi:transposase